MEIDVAETSKELNAETSLYYGVYPAEGRSARYYSAWAVEDPALPRHVVARRGSRWMSVDPLSKK